MEWNEFQGLNYLQEKKDGASSAVVLFHGYGADANDLASLSENYPQKGIDWYFPQGLLEVPVGPMMTGRGWFSIENRNWDALGRGEIDDSRFSETVLDTLGTVVNFLDQIGKGYDNIIVGGFSQGAILTTHAFYRTQFVAKGIVLLSGYLVSPSEFPTLSPSHGEIPFFQSHGRQDAVLPLGGAKKLRSQLSSLGLKGDLQVFEGGHEIPLDIQKMVQKFILNRIG